MRMRWMRCYFLGRQGQPYSSIPFFFPRPLRTRVMPLRLEKAATAVALLLVPGADSFMLAPSARALARRSGSYLLRAASTSTSSPSTTEEAKAALKDALVKSGGSTLAEGVVAATEALAGFNPTSSPAGAWPLHSGRWESIGEDFKGTTRTADGMECTLGRLAFNIFEPVKLPVLITGIEHTVGDRAEDADATDRPVYNFHVRWVSRDGSGLRGLCDIEGRCSEHPSKPQRIQVQFLKGTLRPDDGQDLEAWRKVVGVKDAKDDEKKGSMARLKESATKLLLKVAFGFKGPADTQGPGGELSYEMARSPKGFMDILYLDEEMRVSRGNAGGVVVATRL